jgi:hypothetical protein
VAKGTRCWRIEQPLRGLRPRLAGEGFRPIPPCRWLEDQAQFSSCTRTPRGRSRRPRAKEADRPRPPRSSSHAKPGAAARNAPTNLEGRHARRAPMLSASGPAGQAPRYRAAAGARRANMCSWVRRGPVRGVRRAVEARNLTRAIAEARDLPQISLVDAAEVVVLAADDPRTIFQSVGWTTGRSVRARRTQPHARRGAACADCSSWAPARETGASRRSRSSRFSPRATGRGSSDHSGGCSRRLERSRGTEDSAAQRRGSRVRRAGSLFRA